MKNDWIQIKEGCLWPEDGQNCWLMREEWKDCPNVCLVTYYSERGWIAQDGFCFYRTHVNIIAWQPAANVPRAFVKGGI